MSSISVLPCMTSPRTTKDLFEGLKQLLFVANAGRMFKKNGGFHLQSFVFTFWTEQAGRYPTKNAMVETAQKQMLL